MTAAAKPDFPCILFTRCIQVLNADAEEQESLNNNFRELQPRHPGSYVTSTGPTFALRKNTDVEGLLTFFSTPFMAQLSSKAPHKQITTSSGTKLLLSGKQLQKTSKTALLMLLILLGPRHHCMGYSEQPGLWRPNSCLKSTHSSQRLPCGLV